MRFTKPTFTGLVFDCLVKSDDFLTATQIVEQTKLTRKDVMGALVFLKTRKAVDCLVDSGESYWYATPETDDRLRKVDERRPELRQRSRRWHKKPQEEK